MAVQAGHYISTGWISRAELYFNNTKLNTFPLQSDMTHGRRWLKPNNNSDVISPSKIVGTPLNTRYAYGGLSFTWGLQGLSPKMVSYIQSTFFAPTIGNPSFYQRAYSNRLTVQTYNRGSGEWETYYTYCTFGDVSQEAEPALGGYNNLQLKFLATKTAPEGPDVAIITTYGTYTQMVHGTISASIDNVGDTNTFNNTQLNWAVPTGVTLVSVDNSNWNSTIEYSINSGVSWSITPPAPIDSATNVRITLNTELNAGSDTGNFTITIRPDEDATTFTSTFTATTNGDSLLTGNNTDTDIKAVATFTPLALSPVLWLDASSTVYEIDATLQLATNTTSVESWVDLSGSAIKYIQSTGANKPVYRTGQQNGRPALDFDGVNDSMVASNFSGIVSTENTTLIFVMNATNSSVSPLYEPLLTTTYGNIWAHKSNDGALTTAGVLFGQTGFAQEWTALGNANSGIQILAFTTNNNNVTLHRSSILIGTDSSVQNIDGIRNSTLGGSTLTPNGFFDGLIYEVIGYNSSLSTNDRQAIEYYLINKYAI